MNNPIEAPRFHAYFQRIEGRTVLTWTREEWDAIFKQPEETVPLDVTVTPIGKVARDASVIACHVSKSSTNNPKIEIFRDDSTHYNKDTYQVLIGEELRCRSDFMDIVLACGTEANSNLNEYIHQNVFIVKDGPGNDHVLKESELPEAVRIKIKHK